MSDGHGLFDILPGPTSYNTFSGANILDSYYPLYPAGYGFIEVFYTPP
jgi:hypothetical protein